MNRPIADIWRRIAACGIDVAIPLAVAAATWGVLTVIENVVGRPVGIGITMLWFVLIGVAWFVILSAMQAGQGSPGMRTFGTRLIGSEDLRPLGFGRTSVRNLVWFIGCLVVIGCFSPLFDRSGGRQGWHDRITRAIVVQRRKRTPVMPQLPHADRRASEWLAAMSMTQGSDTGTITDVPATRINHYMTTTDHPRRDAAALIDSVPGAGDRQDTPAAQADDAGAEAKRRIEAAAARMQAERLQEERRRLQMQEHAKRDADARAAADASEGGAAVTAAADDLDVAERAAADDRAAAAPARDEAEIAAAWSDAAARAGAVAADQAAAQQESLEQAGFAVPPAQESSPAVRTAAPMPSRAEVESLVAMSSPPAARGAGASVRGGVPGTGQVSTASGAIPTSGTGTAVSEDESTAVTSAPSSRIAQELSGVRAVATVVWDDGMQYRIYSRTVFGRNPDPGARGQIATIYDNSLSLSKTHFEITRTLDDRAEIVDLHSTNGVMLRREGQAALIQPGEPVLLRSGDVIEIGSRRARVEVIS